MRIGVMIGREAQSVSQPPEVKPPPTTLEELIREAQQFEAQGFAMAWLPHIFEFDAIGAMTAIGRETQQIELGTAVVPTFPRHPVALAQQALTAQAATRGRFTLGIGLSHRLVIEDMLGLPYAKLTRHMQEYLAVLTPLLEGQPAAFQGEFFRVNTALRIPVASRTPLLLAALGPMMLGLAGRFADGTVTWMTGRRTLETHIRPRIRRAAQEAGRAEPRVVAGFPVAITNRPNQAREVAGETFAIYGTLPAYRAMLDREGVAGPADIALVGEAAAVEAELRQLADVGVTDLLAAPFECDAGAMKRTIDFLISQS
jgi:F420-dependent oxidoreductase-like protein